MTLPMSTSHLLEYMPHRPPMVWVDEVTRVHADGGAALVHLKADGFYMGPDGLRASSFIEFLAQAFGFIGICRVLLNPTDGGGSHLKKAFLVAVRDAEFFVESAHADLQPGQTLFIELFGKKDVGPIQLTDGHVKSSNGILLAKAHLKVYAESAES